MNLNLRKKASIAECPGNGKIVNSFLAGNNLNLYISIKGVQFKKFNL